MQELLSGAAARWIQREYGGLFTVRQTTVPVGTAQVVAAEQSPDRLTLGIFNTGTSNVTLSTGLNVASGTGILLLGNGSSLTMNVREDSILVARAFNAISDAAGGSLFVIETLFVGDIPAEGT